MKDKKTEVSVFSETKASSSININISNSDIIDVYIEEKKEELQLQWDAEIARKTELNKDLIDEEVLKGIILAHYAKKFIFKPTKASIYFEGYAHTSIKGGDYKIFRDDLGTKKPNIYRYGAYEPHTKVSKIALDSKDESYVTENPPKELLKKLQKELKGATLANELKRCKALNEHANNLEEINKQYVELLSPRKIKAMFTKKALSNSEDGKGLLAMMKEMGETKMINN